MLEPIIFALAIGLNFIGSTLLLAVFLIVLTLSKSARVNRFLALYVLVCLVWSISALTGRIVMTSGVVPQFSQNDPRVFPLVYLVLVSITGNSPFFYGFALAYVGQWENLSLIHI